MVGSVMIGAFGAALLLPIATLGSAVTSASRDATGEDKDTGDAAPTGPSPEPEADRTGASSDVAAGSQEPIVADEHGEAQPRVGTSDEPDTEPDSAVADPAPADATTAAAAQPTIAPATQDRNGRIRVVKPGRAQRRQQTGEPPDDATAVTADAAPNHTADDQPATATAETPALSVPAGTKTTRKRVVDRAQRQQRAAEQVIEKADDNNPSLGPLVRHLNAVTVHLTDAHRIIGRLSAERDALRRQVTELQGVPPPVVEETAPRPIRATRIEAKAVKLAKRRAAVDAIVDDPELANRAAEAGRRRRLIALSVLAVTVGAIAIYQFMNWTFVPDFTSREALTRIDFVGPLFTYFIIGFVLYRVVRLSSKGARWLFPTEDNQRKRRRG